MFPLAGYFDTGNHYWTAQGLDDVIDDAMTRMIPALGRPPPSLISAWGRWDQFFDSEGNEKARESNWSAWAEMDGPEEADKIQSLCDYTLEELLEHRKPPGTTPEELANLAVLLRAILQYNPEDRISAENALKFKWFTG